MSTSNLCYGYGGHSVGQDLVLNMPKNVDGNNTLLPSHTHQGEDSRAGQYGVVHFYQKLTERRRISILACDWNYIASLSDEQSSNSVEAIPARLKPVTSNITITFLCSYY